MGLASDVSSAVLASALSSDEMRERSEEARSFSSPEATADGQVRERDIPQAEPVRVPDRGWE